MFVDASAVVAVLGAEPDAGEILAKIKTARGGIFYSPLSVYEAAVSLARKKAGPGRNDAPLPRHLIDQAEGFVRRFLNEIHATEVPVTADMGRVAIAACRTYGKAVGHHAKLNLGDCFAYAGARSLNAPLLFKGNDFPETDIERA